MDMTGGDVLVTCWSTKGGSGTTVISVSLALVLAREHGDGALMVDLCGDVPSVLAMPEPDGPGASEWLAAGEEVPADGLRRLEVDAGSGLRVVHRGRAPFTTSGRAEVLASVLAAESRPVVVDCGRIDTDEVRRVVAASGTASLLVTKPCYLALHRAVASPLRPTGVVVQNEPWRALDPGDRNEVLGVPLVAVVPHDPSVARAVDAGLLAARLPRGLARAVRRAA
jgi:Mrp family chromosome partitioning ATPase